MRIKISLIVAAAENRCIGINNQMPWHIPLDLKKFKERTMGKSIIMGRKTFESIVDQLGKPLPGRSNIIVSASGFEAKFIPVFPNLRLAIEKAKENARKADQDEIMIIGGGQLYEQGVKIADTIYLTLIHENYDGDTFFPDINPQEWDVIERVDHMENKPAFSFMTLNRP